jgi:hypothetical protein
MLYFLVSVFLLGVGLEFWLVEVFSALFFGGRWHGVGLVGLPEFSFVFKS